jgi:hypothetical protein
MSTVIHIAENRTVWRGLAGRAPKNDGLFIHDGERGQFSPSSRLRARFPRRACAFGAAKRDLDTPLGALVPCAGIPATSTTRPRRGDSTGSREERALMESSRKPLAKVEGRRRMRLSGVTVAWRGTPNLDDWVAYIVNGTKSKKLILADHASERKVKTLLSRLQTLSRKEIEKLAKS